MVDGRPCQLDGNFHGRHCLHGGRDGSAEQIWQASDVQPDQVRLSLTLPDGDMGFPGTITMNAVIAPRPDALHIGITATTDAPMPCNIVHHGYFNLHDIDRNRLQISAAAPIGGRQHRSQRLSSGRRGRPIAVPSTNAS